MKDKKSNRVLLTGVIAALAASSCCIPPFIVLIAGVGGVSSSLSWVEPFRPYLIGLAIIAMGYSWYVHLKSKAADDCGCEVTKPKFYQTRGFLIGVTIFAILSITLPYYSGLFYSEHKQEVTLIDNTNVQKINLSIEGMTCDACQNHVNHAIDQLSGIVVVKTSYPEGNAIIEFDNTQTNMDEIEKAINSIGYKATKIEKK